LSDKQNDNNARGEKEYHRRIASVKAAVNDFFDRNFTETRIDGPRLDAEELQKSPVMFVSTHRSHVDYFLAGISFFKMGFRNLRFAAGDNLTKLPYIGPRFLAFGAFAVARDGGFERNYVRNLCAQVVKMLEDGDAVLVFPEGGRSYTGAMLDIKGGILNAALMTQAANPNKDVYLLPAAISYECPPDVPFFPTLLKGRRCARSQATFSSGFWGACITSGRTLWRSRRLCLRPRAAGAARYIWITARRFRSSRLSIWRRTASKTRATSFRRTEFHLT